MENEKELPIIYHTLELRSRFLYICACILVNFSISYFYSQQLCSIIAEPLLKLNEGHSDIGFIYTNLTEAFFSYLKISIFTSIFLSIPYILIQIWLFIIPGLFLKERKKITIILFLFLILILLGIYTAYTFVLPIAWKFFFSFQIPYQDRNGLSLHLQPKMDQYITLALNILITLGIVFHLPIYLYFTIVLNIVSYKWFVLRRNISFVTIFILAALISPPDIISQILIGIPLFFLYEFVIFLVYVNKAYTKIS